MKTLIILSLCFTVSQLQARCSSGSIYAPSNNQLNQNSCLLIEGYGNKQNIIDGLNDKYPIYLESENKHRVNLKVKYTNKGMFRVNQALLQPEEDLILGESYHLEIGNIPDKESDLGYGLLNQSYTITADKKTTLAKLMIEPKFVMKNVIYYSCGPSIAAEFEFITDTDTDYMIETELVDLENNTKHTYYLPPAKDGIVSIGHNMCSGAFNFVTDHKYKVRFSIINSCNDAAYNWTKWIEFDSPYQSNRPIYQILKKKLTS